MSNNQSFLNYRTALHSVDPPCIPFLYVPSCIRLVFMSLSGTPWTERSLALHIGVYI
jgi:hypothetical protein